MEQLFFNANFHYVEIIPVSNGVKWSVQQMCEQIATFYKARNFFGDRIVVWIDREGRNEGSDVIAAAIRERLIMEGAQDNQLAILVCDRMTENVILADHDFIRSEIDDPNYVYGGDGTGGKHQLKTLYKNRGIAYKETQHGIRCLKKIRLARSAKHSDQVASFLNQINLDCWWIE